MNNEITGFKNFYDHMIDQLDTKSSWLEVGAWLGNSITYAANESKKKNKHFNFTVVDQWKKYDELANFFSIEEWNNDLPYQTFLENIKSYDNINYRRGISWEVAESFNDNSFDFIFIDGAHDYDSVYKDIRAYWPKVKLGGWFAGDDFRKGDFPGLEKAVREWSEEIFGSRKAVQRFGRCWMIRK